MDENKKICGLYMRVSTEDQAREGFSLSEQKARLEAFCNTFGYHIKEYYEDAGISAKTCNYRPEFERMLEDGRQGKINMIVALKLDRITRCNRDWEKLMVVKDQVINAIRIDDKEFISLTDLARYADEDDPRYPIQNRMINKDVISYLCLWESIHNKISKVSNSTRLKRKLVVISLKYHLKNGLEKQMQLE